jgi:hypothetical protein
LTCVPLCVLRLRVYLRYSSHDPLTMWTLYVSKTGWLIFWGPLGSYKRRDLDRFILIIFGLWEMEVCGWTGIGKKDHYIIYWGATVPRNEAYTLHNNNNSNNNNNKTHISTSSCACVKWDVFVLVNTSWDWRIKCYRTA